MHAIKWLAHTDSSNMHLNPPCSKYVVVTPVASITNDYYVACWVTKNIPECCLILMLPKMQCTTHARESLISFMLYSRTAIFSFFVFCKQNVLQVLAFCLSFEQVYALISNLVLSISFVSPPICSPKTCWNWKTILLFVFLNNGFLLWWFPLRCRPQNNFNI